MLNKSLLNEWKRESEPLIFIKKRYPAMVFDMLKKIIKYGIDVVYRYTSNKVGGHQHWLK